MTRRISLGLIVLLGCGATETGPVDDGPVVDGPGPVDVGLVDGPVGGFAFESLAAPATSAVAAATPDGALHYAYIDGTTGWPVLRDADGVRHELPGGTHPNGHDGAALVASNDGALHLVTTGGGDVYYARLRDGAFDAVQTVSPVPARDATVAIAPDGTVVVAYVAEPVIEEPAGAGEPPRIHVVRGTPGPDGVAFGAPVVANPSCCFNELGEPAEDMSGPSLVVDRDGAAHIVFEWTTFYNSTIEYVHDRGGQFNAPVTISEAAFVPCPALAVDDSGKAYITFLEEPNRDVFFVEVEDGVPSERTSLYTTQEYITMSMMVLDAAGDMHVAVTDNTGPGGRLLYVPPGSQPDDPPVEITLVESPGFVELTPRAGGMLVSPDGSLLLGYERVPAFGEMGTAEVAASR